MSARDELADLIGGCGYDESDPKWGIADAVLTAGWRPPARVIDTVEELATLPDISVILGADDVVYRRNPWNSKRDSRWVPFDGHSAFDRDFGVDHEEVALPATVLWESGDPR